MPATVNEQTVDAVNLTNAKLLGELHSLTAGLSAQNALAQQQRANDIANSVHSNAMNSAQQIQQLAAQQALNLAAQQSQLQQVLLARQTRYMLDTSGEQAAAFNAQMGANLQQKLSELGAALSATQQDAKIAQTTPPQTGTGGAFGSDSGSALMQQIVNSQTVIANGIQAILQTLQGLHAAPTPPK